ncbi:M28 family peptidase [Halobacterium wangiae]|uniref:M28 family peptidase n=1 Tax=Halobacterium wangiae TaxID=2902623 RepID=UPI001E3A313E|nr:M28 family peptidase [Halobacterium wangiae]
MAQWIGETFASDAGWDHLVRLTDIGSRMAGSEGERVGAEATRDAFERVGVRNVRLDEFDLQGWERGDSTLTTSDEDLDCIALPRSPAATAAGELVDLGYGTPEDFETTDVDGKVVQVASNMPSHADRLLHRTEKYYLAVEGGAAGFVFRNHVDGCLPPTGSVGRTDQPIGEIPAVGVSKEVGHRLGRRHCGEQVTVSVSADIGPATSQNVHASVGPDTDERVLVTSHVDGHDVSEGAADNASGTAMLVAVAEALSRRADDLDSRVEFVAYGAEEVGLCGSDYHAAQTDESAVRAIVNLDGVVQGRTLQFFTHTFDELEAAVERATGHFNHPARVIPKEGYRGDQWPLVRWGVPGYFVSGVREAEGRGYGHTAADTLDKLDRRNVNEQAILLTELAVDLAREETEIPHRSEREVAESFREEGRVEGMKLVGDWPYDFE